jgi:hypothetical protein
VVARRPFFRLAPDYGGDQRTRVRQRAILRAEPETPEDEDDWTLLYPDRVVGWLADILKAVDFHYTPAQVLEAERLYPGLWDDLALELWQRDLVKQQMAKPNDNGR